MQFVTTRSTILDYKASTFTVMDKIRMPKLRIYKMGAKATEYNISVHFQGPSQTGIVK